jgi:hypothetical protein
MIGYIDLIWAIVSEPIVREARAGINRLYTAGDKDLIVFIAFMSMFVLLRR